MNTNQAITPKNLLNRITASLSKIKTGEIPIGATCTISHHPRKSFNKSELESVVKQKLSKLFPGVVIDIDYFFDNKKTEQVETSASLSSRYDVDDEEIYGYLEYIEEQLLIIVDYWLFYNVVGGLWRHGQDQSEAV